MGWPSLSDVTNAASNAYNTARDTVTHGVDSVTSAASSAIGTTRAAVSEGVATLRSTAHDAVSSARDFAASARDRAEDLGRAGLDAGRRAVDAVSHVDVRHAAAVARSGISHATDAARDGITTATNWSAARVGDAADWSRSQVTGDDVASQAFRGLITQTEESTRFQLGVAGGVVREVASTVGAVGQLAVTGAEMQVSPEARVEYGTAIVNGLNHAGDAVDGYVNSVAADPSRLGGDLKGAWDSASGFVGDTASRYGKAMSEGRSEEIGMDVGAALTYVVPIGGGPARGALTAAVRETGEVAVRGTAEALTRTGAQAMVRDGAQVTTRATAGATTHVAADATTAAVEQRGAAMLDRITAGGGTAPLPNGAGRLADLAAASRQSGSELAVYRDAASGQRMVTAGAADAVSVPAGSRLIAHTQPGIGAAALTPSARDLAGLGALGQRSSAIVDQAGGLARFGIDDARLASSTRAGADEAVRFEAPAAAQAGTATPAHLLPGEGNVGTYRDLVSAGAKGDNITPHHIPSANRMAAEGVSKGDGVAINMEQPSPGIGGRHRATFTYGSQADLAMTPRQALAAGVLDARRIYMAQGLYTPEIRRSLLEVVRMNLQLHPQVFGR